LLPQQRHCRVVHGLMSLCVTVVASSPRRRRAARLDRSFVYKRCQSSPTQFRYVSANTAEPIEMPFGESRLVWAQGTVCVRLGAHWRHLTNITERTVLPMDAMRRVTLLQQQFVAVLLLLFEYTRFEIIRSTKTVGGARVSRVFIAFRHVNIVPFHSIPFHSVDVYSLVRRRVRRGFTAVTTGSTHCPAVICLLPYCACDGGGGVLI